MTMARTTKSEILRSSWAKPTSLLNNLLPLQDCFRSQVFVISQVRHTVITRLGILKMIQISTAGALRPRTLDEHVHLGFVTPVLVLLLAH